MKKGFTLIELLVVISIIGLLSSVILASLKSARIKAADATAISDMKTVQTQAAIFYSDNGGTYGVPFSGAAPLGTTVYLCDFAPAGTLFQDPKIRAAIVAAQQATGYQAECVSTASAYMVQIALKGTLYAGPLETTAYWCTDSMGAAKKNDVGVAFSPSTLTCP